ncbi:MAG TPA: LLM class F420-dependent oxidoreductase [Actinomycetota bacterium]|nr:LLM class F420-dependent oxidoreductase [Actinomycetota bacterium]
MRKLDIKLGLQIPLFDFPGVGPDGLFERVADIARAAEANGFDSVWVMDHFEQIMGDPAAPILEGYVVLAGIAARTEHVNLGTLVTGVIYRNPAVLAKMVTSLDVLSKGRAVLGIGAAWNESEQEHYGIERVAVSERMDRLDEAIQICKLMFTEEAPSFEGRYFEIAGAHNVPRPIRRDGIPIMVGGGGERRTLRAVAQYADACNIFGDPATIRHKMKVLDEHCADVRRDPREITRTALKTLIIGRDAAEAEAKAAPLRARYGERFDVIGVAGGPDEVRAIAHEHLDAGLDGLIVNLPDAHDLDTVALAGDTLRTL